MRATTGKFTVPILPTSTNATFLEGEKIAVAHILKDAAQQTFVHHFPIKL